MRVRLYGLQRHVGGKHVGVGDRVAALSCWNVDPLRPQTKDCRRPCRGAIAEVQTNARPDELAGAARLHVQLNDEVSPSLEPPRHVRRDQRRQLPWCPAEEMSFRIHRRSRHQPVVARRRIAGVERARARGWIEPDVRVMDDARIARLEFEAGDVLRAADRERHDEDAKRVARTGVESIGLGQRDDEIGRAELPPLSESRR